MVVWNSSRHTKTYSETYFYLFYIFFFRFLEMSKNNSDESDSQAAAVPGSQNVCNVPLSGVTVRLRAMISYYFTSSID